MCGKTSLNALYVNGIEPLRDIEPAFAEELLCTIPDKLRRAQKIIDETGGLPAADLAMMVSGRASFEFIQKTLIAGIPLLAAVSAPSSLAVQLAREFNMTLIGSLRGKTFNIYSGGERIRS